MFGIKLGFWRASHVGISATSEIYLDNLNNSVFAKQEKFYDEIKEYFQIDKYIEEYKKLNKLLKENKMILNLEKISKYQFNMENEIIPYLISKDFYEICKEYKQTGCKNIYLSSFFEYPNDILYITKPNSSEKYKLLKLSEYSEAKQNYLKKYPDGYIKNGVFHKN